jgi:5-amino-6-(5-phosphoribosylamino)uracil reductase
VTSDRPPRERFQRFVERKEADAAASVLSPFTTEVDIRPLGLASIGTLWTRTLFDGPFYVSPPPADDLPATSLVFVQSRDKNTVASDPSTLGGGQTDQLLIYEGLSRAGADAVLAGAGTIRGGDVVFSVWHPEIVALRSRLGLPRHPIQIVATLRGPDLDALLLFNVPELRVVVLIGPDCADRVHEGLADRPWITPVRTAGPDDLPSAFRAFRRMGIQRVSCVGGRTIATALIDQGLIRDLYLTTSPQPGGQLHTPLYDRPLAARTIVRKCGTGRDTGVVFEHLSLSRGPGV